MYKFFGFGAIHGIHAKILAQTVAFNGGKKIGWLPGAGTSFET